MNRESSRIFQASRGFRAPHESKKAPIQVGALFTSLLGAYQVRSTMVSTIGRRLQIAWAAFLTTRAATISSASSLSRSS